LDGKAVFRFITNDSTTTMKTLSRLPNMELKEAEIIVHKMINRPGELGKITRKLANRKINLESLYIVSRKPDFTEVAIKTPPEYLEKAKEVLENK